MRFFRDSFTIAPRHRVPLLILFALTLAYWSRVLFTGQVLLPGAFLRGFAPFGADAQAPWTILQWDALGQYFPWRTFAARELQAGHIPLWNPHQFNGTPFIANGQSAVFYPLNVVFWILDPAYAFGVSAFLHTLLAAFGTYFLTQHWQMSRAASLLSAIAFGFCGYLASWVMLPTLANTASWLPVLLLVAGDRWAVGSGEMKQKRGSYLLPCLLACALLAGHPQIFFFLLLALGVQALFVPQPGRVILQLIGAGTFAGLLGAIQLLPMLELARLGHRATDGGPTAGGWAGIVQRAWHIHELPALFIPGWPMQVEFAESLNENFPYTGIGVCLLVLCALILAKPILAKQVSTTRSRSRTPFYFAGALALLGLLYAFATPLPQLLYWSVPGLSQMGGVGRALFLWHFGAAVLAGFGLDALRSKVTSSIVPIVALLVVIGELFAFGWAFQPTAPRATIYPDTQVTAFLQKNQREGERVWFITPQKGWQPAEFLQQNRRNHPPGVLPPNGATVYGINDINGYDSLAPNAYRTWLMKFAPKPSPDFNGNMILLEDLPAPALDALNVRYVVSLTPRDILGETLVLNAENCFVYERKIAAAVRVNGSDFHPGWKDNQYQPEAFRFGAFISLCALSVLGAQWTVDRLRQRAVTSTYQ